ncbi:MAG: tetratricopeptide repeat protein, partial [Candidatus Omnitrophica bacterium]|nr:tetratricopeptide repeat protein [Candidatus Omnitrophota bacterium]
MKNIKLVLFVLGLNIIFADNVYAKDAETDKIMDETGTKINPEVLYKDYIDQGLYFFERGMLNRAKYLFYNAKELMPDKPDSYINMAAIAMKRNNFSLAAKILEKSLKLTDNAKQDAIFCNLGSCYQKLEKYEEAKKCYEKAISLNPELGNALFNLGMLDLKEGREDTALINILKARVVFREQDNKDVVRSCDETLFSIIKNHKDDAKLAQILLTQGSASFENKRNEEAIALLKISLL